MRAMHGNALSLASGLVLACSGPTPSPGPANPAPTVEQAESSEEVSPVPEVAATCETNSDCSWDDGSSSCIVGTDNPTDFLDFGGDHCGCDPTSGTCLHTRFEPVPCQTDDDCGYSRDPVLHPVPSTTPRERPFRPCIDGEVDSVCGTMDGESHCRVEAWAC
jgi:hypothetical protein